MTLYEYLQMTECDYDTYDTKYDNGVTVCHIYGDDECDDYDKFCNGIAKKVDVVKINGDILIVNWSELIERNMDKFKKFTKKHWNRQYEDDIDEFVYQWINEIHMYIAGYVSESFYTKLIEFVDSLE
jgi:hypothetical protein